MILCFSIARRQYFGVKGANSKFPFAFPDKETRKKKHFGLKVKVKSILNIAEWKLKIYIKVLLSPFFSAWMQVRWKRKLMIKSLQHFWVQQNIINFQLHDVLYFKIHYAAGCCFASLHDPLSLHRMKNLIW